MDINLPALDDNVLVEGEIIVNEQATTISEFFLLRDEVSKLKKNVVRKNDFDDKIINRVFNTTSTTTQTQNGLKFLSTFKELQEDLFLALYQHKPIILSDRKIRHEMLLNKEIILDLAHNTEEFRDIRFSTKNAITTSYLAVDYFTQHILETLERWSEEYEYNKYNVVNKETGQLEDFPGYAVNLNNTMYTIEDGIRDIEQALRELMKLPQTIAIKQTISDLTIELNNLLSIQAQTQESFKNAMLASKNTIDCRMKQILMDALLHVVDTDKYLDCYGIEDSSVSTSDLQSKKRAIEKIQNSHKLKQIADETGRLKDIIPNLTKRKTKEIRTDICDVHISNEIENMLPSEYINLIKPKLKSQFYKKYVNSELLTYEKNSIENKGKGPMIVCLDESGSMRGHNEIWSKATVISLLNMAQDQKRDFVCIRFANTCPTPLEFEKGVIDSDKLLNLSGTFLNGGTNFNAPLLKCIDFIDKAKYSKADIIFITDGESHVMSGIVNSLKTYKKEKGLKIIGVLMDYNTNCSSSIEKFCDTVTRMSSINDKDNAFKDVFENIIDHDA